MVKYVGPLAVYKIIDLHNYLLMTLDGKLLRGVFEHKRIKPAIIRTSEGNVTESCSLETSDVNRDNGSVKNPKDQRNRMCLKAVDVRK